MAVTIVLLVSLVGAIGAHNLLGFFRAIWLWTAAREQTAETADGDEAEIERRQEEYLAAMRAKADAKAAANHESWFVSGQGRKRASACVGCGSCETACPQHSPIRETLRRANAAFP